MRELLRALAMHAYLPPACLAYAYAASKKREEREKMHACLAYAHAAIKKRRVRRERCMPVRR